MMAYDTPDMGLGQILQMAQVAQPIMQPNAPLGAPSAMGVYNRDKERQDGMLNQAQTLANLMASMKGQSSKEYMQGAPGREAEVGLQNILSQDKANSSPDLVATQREGIQTGLTEAKTKRMLAEDAQLGDYANMFSQPGADIKDVRKKMESDGYTHIGRRALSEVPDDKLAGLLQNSRLRQVNTPAQAGKEQLEAMRDQTWISREEIRAKARIEASNIAARMSADIQKMKAENRPPNPLNAIYEEIHKKLGVGPAAQWYMEQTMGIANATNANRPQQFDIDTSSMPGIHGRPPVLPQPARLPPGMPSGPAPAAAPPPTVTPQPQVQVEPPAPQPEAPKAAPKTIPIAEAEKILAASKGTKQYEAMKAFYRATYGKEPPK